MAQRKRESQRPTVRKQPSLATDGLLSDINQMRHPKAVRIARRQNARQQLGFSPKSNAALDTEDSQQSVESEQATERLLAEVATCLWDIERKLKAQTDQEMDKKHRLAYRRAIKALDALHEFGLEVEEFTGKRVPTGAGLKMHLQPTPGTTIEIVTETISPSIYFREHTIQFGEVFIAVPPSDENANAVPIPTETPDVVTADSLPTAAVDTLGNNEASAIPDDATPDVPLDEPKTT
jgi:hypothetical protein